MDKAMIEIEKLKEEIELLKEEKTKNTEKQNIIKEYLRIYNNVNSQKKDYLTELKWLKIKKVITYVIYIIMFASMPLGAFIGVFSNPTIGLTLALLGVGSLIVNEIPNIKVVGERILDSILYNIKEDIDNIKNKFEKFTEVGKNRGYYEEAISKLETRNNEIDTCINQKNDRITKLEAIRKEIIEEFSPVLEQKISASYETFIEEDTDAKTKIKR